MGFKFVTSRIVNTIFIILIGWVALYAQQVTPAESIGVDVVDAEPEQLDSMVVYSDSMFDVNSGLVTFGERHNWRFKQGDDLSWAEPDFDDSEWFYQTPFGLFEPLPDSLWGQGHGWFRTRFQADSTIYNRAWFFYFYTWGAAEVYIDGKLINTYGTFAVDPTNEVRFNPLMKILPAITFAPRDTHVVAVRFSYHPARQYKKIMRQFSANFGFGIGLTTEEYNKTVINNLRTNLRVATIASSILLLITLLHIFLFYFFRQDRANLYIAIITFLLFCHCVMAFGEIFFDFDRLWSHLMSQYSFVTVFIWAVLLSPYTVATLFNVENKKAYRNLLWLSIPIFILAIFLLDRFLMIIAVVIAIVFISIVKLLLQSKKNNQEGVAFIALGFVGILVLVALAMSLQLIAGFFNFSYTWEIESHLITAIYLIIPLSMTLFTAKKMAVMQTNLEEKVQERTSQLEKSILDLKSAQDQLVQQEKLASLGQLTAGIAHEIKNPLNFVNNFSEVSIEILDDVLKSDHWKLTGQLSQHLDEKDKAAINSSRDLVVSDLGEIKNNLSKIHDHGSRADRIVKSMLMHSRGGNGKMEQTDLNTLLREYTNLAYHGMRAGKNPIPVDLQFELDDSIKTIPLIAEDFSRVLLNLCNNAFDAMRERQKAEGKSYSPVLKVRSALSDAKIRIDIIDNGPGIPDAIKDQIMEPFFTTKKGTEGTGLGLSITHDIIKAHGGTMTLTSSVGETIFSIALNR